MVPHVLEEPQQFLQSQEAPAANPECPCLCGDPWSKSAGCANSAQTKHFLKSAAERENVDSSENSQRCFGEGRVKRAMVLVFFYIYIFIFLLLASV